MPSRPELNGEQSVGVRAGIPQGKQRRWRAEKEAERKKECPVNPKTPPRHHVVAPLPRLDGPFVTRHVMARLQPNLAYLPY
jgi:hypothetical protein